MAEGSSPTTKLYSVSANLLAGDAATKLTHICLDEGDMSGFDASSTSPATLCTKTDLTIHELTNGEVTVAAGIATAEYTWTAGEAATLKGAEISCSVTPDTNVLAWHRYAADVTLASGEKIQETINCEYKVGA